MKHSLNLSLKSIARITLMAVEHTEGEPQTDYTLGGMDTAGHLLSCLVVQTGRADYMETSSGADMVKDRPSVKVLVDRMKTYLAIEV